jgi:hypothetical protein
VEWRRILTSRSYRRPAVEPAVGVVAVDAFGVAVAAAVETAHTHASQ